MLSTPHGLLSSGIILSFILVTAVSFAPGMTNIDDCDQLNATLKRLTTELATCRKNMKTAKEGLDYCNKQIDMYTERILEQETARDLQEKDSYAYKALDLSVTEAKKGKANFEKKRDQYKKTLATETAEETILVNNFHIVRDRIDKECGGEKKPIAPDPIPQVAGNYNSPYGNAIMTQEKLGDKAKIYVTVYYSDENGGSSKLQGDFDGKKWTFTWRNTFSHYGNGVMSYNKEDGSFSGYWVDESIKPNNRGNWWLRPK